MNEVQTSIAAYVGDREWLKTRQRAVSAQRDSWVTMADLVHELIMAIVATETEKAAAAAERDKALSVPCPECKRPAGSRCITLDTYQPSNIVHKARVEAWKEGE
jgi:hypothetical protein